MPASSFALRARAVSLAVLSLVSIGCAAQQPCPDPAAALAERTKAELIEDLLAAIEMEALMERTMDEAIAVQLQQNANLKPFEDVLRDFIRKHMGWAAVRPVFVAEYEKTFTRQELADLVVFYRSPTGQKAAQAMPRLAAAGMALGQQRVQANQAELAAAIQARVQELQRQMRPDAQPDN